MLLPPELWAVLVFAGQMSDVYTTRRALTYFGDVLYEGNGVMAKVLKRFGFKGMQILKASLAGALFVSVGFLADNEIIWFLLAAFGFIPAFWNVYMMMKAKKEG